MKKGFTIIEVSIIIAIMAVLSAIAIPNILRARCITQCEKDICPEKCIDYYNSYLKRNSSKKAIHNSQTSDLKKENVDLIDLYKYSISDVKLFCKENNISLEEFSGSKVWGKRYDKWLNKELYNIE